MRLNSDLLRHPNNDLLTFKLSTLASRLHGQFAGRNMNDLFESVVVVVGVDR